MLRARRVHFPFVHIILLFAFAHGLPYRITRKLQESVVITVQLVSRVRLLRTITTLMARSHSALRSAVSRYERVQLLRAAVGRKVERIINAGSVHTARDVALRSVVR
jgi:hypothetical protein